MTPGEIEAICQSAMRGSRMRSAVREMLDAIDDHGSHPRYHRKVVRETEERWPVLWARIAKVREVLHG